MMSLALQMADCQIFVLFFLVLPNMVHKLINGEFVDIINLLHTTGFLTKDLWHQILIEEC